MQVDTMQIRHEEENRLKERKFEAELHKLKEEIAYTFEQYSDGKIGAKSLLVGSRLLCRTGLHTKGNMISSKKMVASKVH